MGRYFRLLLTCLLLCAGSASVWAQEVTPQSAKGITTSGPPPSTRMLDFEAEDLFNSNKTMVSGGKVGPQFMAGFGSGWSNNTQLFWGQGSTGAVLDLVLDVPMAATYAIELYMTRAPDYGILKIEVDGKASTVEFHGYSPRVIGANPVQVGKFSLQAGQRKISFMITGKNQNSTGYAAGIDRVKLYPVGAPSREPISRNTVLPAEKYSELISAKSQILQTVPNLSEDAGWQPKLPQLKTNLERIETILTQVRNASDADIRANKSYYNNLASELLEWETYIQSLEEEFSAVSNERQMTYVGVSDGKKKAQIYNMLSAIRKALHELAMGIVQNVR